MDSEKYILDELGNVVYLLELCHYRYAYDDFQNSKKYCLSCIKILNKLVQLQSPQFNEIINELSKLTIVIYEKITNESKGKLISLNGKIIWIHSKVNGLIFPPVLNITSSLDTMNCMFPGKSDHLDQALTVPSKINYLNKYITTSDWLTNKFDLENLYQDLLSNCSFVSAFISIALNDKHLLLVNSITPFHDNGDYKVKLYFNGSWRIVNIDNTLPIVDRRSLIMKSSSNDNLYWPAFIEKAYLKVMGSGYNFNGSNHAYDIFTMLSWIPEIIYISNGQLPVVLQVALTYHSEGNALIGFGTGKVSPELCKQLGVVSNHDYSFKSFENGCLKLINPWLDGSDEQDSRVRLFYDLNIFKYFYINWNPSSLFEHTSKTVFIYNVAGQSYNKTYKKPQYSLINRTQSPQKVWILLEKFLDLREADVILQMHIYQTNFGEKVVCPVQYVCENESSPANGNILLVKFEMKPMTSYTIVISSSTNSTYCLTLYHNICKDYKLEKARAKYTTAMPVIKDEWTNFTNGGPWNYSSYIDNPEYLFKVRKPMKILISLFSDPKAFVNIHIFHSDRSDDYHKIKVYDRTSLIVEQKYNLEFQFLEVQLQPGSYKCIFSTFDRNTCPFEVFVNHEESSEEFTIEKIPNNLGLFTTKSIYQWNNNNRLKIYLNIENFNLDLMIHLKSTDGNVPQRDTDYRPAIRGSVFNAKDSSPICINEDWSNCLYGTFIACSIYQPGTYILLVERFEQGEGNITISVGSNKKFSIDK